jgi:hypothetical protein
MFELNADQKKQLDEWMEEQYKKAIEIQKNEVPKSDDFYGIYEESWEMGYPYEGAVGGGITFCFTPTSIGDICVVKYALTKAELDITDFGSW